MTQDDLEKLLREHGWEFKDQKKHRNFIHPEIKGKIQVPAHKGDIPIGTLNYILKQAGIKK